MLIPKAFAVLRLLRGYTQICNMLQGTADTTTPVVQLREPLLTYPEGRLKVSQ
jgi:hypothetical protein